MPEIAIPELIEMLQERAPLEFDNSNNSNIANVEKSDRVPTAHEPSSERAKSCQQENVEDGDAARKKEKKRESEKEVSESHTANSNNDLFTETSNKFVPFLVDQILQTHISIIILGCRTAYKLKKHVEFGFVDFSNLKLRFQSCVDEIQLNRRLCPLLYASVVRIRMNSGKRRVIFGEEVDITPKHSASSLAEDSTKYLQKTSASNKDDTQLQGRKLSHYFRCLDAIECRKEAPSDVLWEKEVERLGAEADSGVSEPIIDYAVKMHRLPQVCLFSHLLDKYLVSENATTQFNPNNSTEERQVQMRRLSLELQNPGVFSHIVDHIADELIPFYKALLRDEQQSKKNVRILLQPANDGESSSHEVVCGGWQSVMYNVEENFRQMRSFGMTEKILDSDHEQIEAIEKASLTFLKTYKWLFEKRMQEGRIIDGHGDLHTGNIFVCPIPFRAMWDLAHPSDEKATEHNAGQYLDLIDEAIEKGIMEMLSEGGVWVQIFDCVEFNERLRRHDISSDVAFLCMDLYTKEKQTHAHRNLAHDIVEKNVGGRLAARFLRRLATQLQDLEMLKLIHFYACYRAVVRAKVYGMQCSRLEGGSSAEATKAKLYLQVAADFAAMMEVRDLAFNAPLVVIMCGFTGCGKSFIARRLSRMLSLKYLSTDDIRNAVVGENNSNRYSQESRNEVYERLLSEAWQHLHNLESGIVQTVNPLEIPNKNQLMQEHYDERHEHLKSEKLLDENRNGRINEHNGCLFDGTFLTKQQRARVYSFALSNNCIIAVLRVVAPENVIKERIAQRQLQNASLPPDAKLNTSEGTEQVLEMHKLMFQDFGEVDIGVARLSELQFQITIDSTAENPIEDAYDALVSKFSTRILTT